MMHDAMVQIFGEYAPVITVLENGRTFCTVDVGYVAGVAIFGVCLYSLFKLIGVLFKR